MSLVSDGLNVCFPLEKFVLCYSSQEVGPPVETRLDRAMIVITASRMER